MSFVLQDVTERDLVHRAVLGAQPLLIGSGGRADVVLDGPGVSVRHARLGLEAAGPWVRDLGSTDGTRVNGEATDGRHPLGPGDLIGIGPHLLRVVSPTDETATPGPALTAALAQLPPALGRRLRAEAMADRWEADAWRAIVADPALWIDRIDDRDALLAAIAERLREWSVPMRVDERFPQRTPPLDLGPAMVRRIRSLQRMVAPLIERAVVVRDLRAATKRFQRAQLERALKATGGNRAQAADRLGVSRQFVYRLLDALGAEPSDEG